MIKKVKKEVWDVPARGVPNRECRPTSDQSLPAPPQSAKATILQNGAVFGTVDLFETPWICSFPLPRQKSRVERLRAKVAPLLTWVTVENADCNAVFGRTQIEDAYRGTSPITKHPLLGPYSRPVHRSL